MKFTTFSYISFVFPGHVTGHMTHHVTRVGEDYAEEEYLKHQDLF